MKAIIFPGQGAQYIGMGKSLYENFPQAKDIFDKIDSILKYKLSEKCFFGPEEDLKETSVQQLAILGVSLAALEVFKKYNIKIDLLSGLSLGEYSCLYASSVLSLEDLVLLVKERAQAMQEAAKGSNSTMLAIMGIDREILKEKANKEGFYLSNINSPGQIVISLKKDDVIKIKTSLESFGAKVIELIVSGGFHSPFMEPAKKRLIAVIESLSFNDPLIPIVSNVTAKAHYLKDDIKNNLIEQLISPVLWNDCVAYMAKEGVDLFFELGPGKVLKGLIRKIDQNLKVINLEKEQDLASFKD